ncbi:MAG: hypothetical protein AB1657_05490 [Candidatus Micrarchaeota archaeon]
MGIGASLSRGVDLTFAAVKETVEFHRKGFWDYIKYWAVSAGIGIAGLIAMAIPPVALFLVFISNALSGWALVAAGAVLGILSLAALAGAATLSTSVIFASIRFVAGGQKEPYLQGRDYGPAFRYLVFYYLVILAASVVLIGMPLALMFGPLLLASGAGAGAAIAAVTGMFVGIFFFYAGIFALMIVVYAFMFVYIYGVYEVAADGIAPVAALKRSWALVKRNFWETLLFFIAALVIAEVLNTLLSLVLVPFFLLAVLTPLAWVLVVIAAVVVSIVAEAAIAPVYVFFWQKIRRQA